MFGKRRRKHDDDAIQEEDASFVEAENEPTFGPFDSEHAPDDDVLRLDLGSLRIPALPGLKLGMPADDRGRLRQEVVISSDDSVLRVAICAAPRLDGIWEEVREELTASVVKQGGTTTETEGGPYGIELVAQQPAGKTGDTVTLRYIGIDGPRWFIRALFQGARAGTSEADSILDDCLRGMVVERGSDAMPVREPLPLQVPADMLEEHKKRAAAKQAPAKTTSVNGSKPAAKRKPSPKPRKR